MAVELPTDLIATLYRAIDATRVYRGAIEAAETDLRATPEASPLMSERRIDLPSEEEACYQAHRRLHAWAEQNLASNGLVIRLPWNLVEEALCHGKGDRWTHRRAAWATITLETTARHLIDTYGPNADVIAGEQTFIELRRHANLHHVETRRGRMVIPIYARSTLRIGGVARHLEYDQRRNLIDALAAIDAAMRWIGGPCAALGQQDITRLNDVLDTQFAYRRREPVPCGEIVLFKEHVDLILTPEVGEAMALFLSHHHERLHVA